MYVVELVELCLSHLNSPGDLKSCALVCRLWVDTAQSYLFRAPKIIYSAAAYDFLGLGKPQNTWNHLLGVLTSSSSTHLVTHIRTLHIRTQVTQETLSAICAFPFTRVTTIAFAYSGVLPASVVPALRALLALPTLQRVKLQCTFSSPAHFARLWDSMRSPHSSIQHVALGCDAPVQSLTDADLILSSPRGGEGRPLESLYLLPHNVVNSRAPPTHNVPWRVLAPVVRSAKKLEVVVNSTTMRALAPVLFPSASPGASAFPNLTTLRLYIPPWVPSPMRLALTEQLFAGLAGPASVKKPPKLHTLVLAPLSDTDSALYAVLDEALCALELQLKLEVDEATYAFILPFFPRLEASGAVSRTEGGVYWWYVGREGVW
ncbi:hypothetical protein DFH08DRAFT_804424 [Mycena albidolilacea]|uniref:F-box domain-containing protein n=1 Tax=Mycena albidolilacea TaxID=1033008 RepID=A0AAD7EYH9_9AGAR|nr:hypothetical protein DFH08DRAFT_804424 [Mycena albidolilacea]